MHSSTPSQHGWCGTCKTDDDADKGKEGYCDWTGGKNGTQSEIMRPTSKKDWGWCSRTCNNFRGVARTLQETKLDLLTLNQCSDFDAEMQFNRKNELCAGKKNYFPEVWKFKRNQSARKKSYHFKKIGTSTNYLGQKKTKYNFYVGGTDSCAGNYHQCIATHNCHIYHFILSGDSGGPYYQWFDTGNGRRAAYIIGVVSRGKGCANFNSPGIFTRITKHLKWIKKHTRSGDC